MKVRLIMLAALVFLFTTVICSIDETVTIQEPFVLCRLIGSINSAKRPWPENFASSFVRFELVGPDESQKVWIIQLDDQGRFNRKLPKGTYKFTIEVDGWDDAEGVVIINPKADKKNRFSVTLNLS